MPCYHPVKVWRYTAPCGPNLNRPIIHAQDYEHALSLRQYPIPIAEAMRACAQCVGCRLRKACYTAVRCVHEASLHSENCFLTLTYNRGSCPSNGSIMYEHVRDFWKRLRDRFDYPKFKYYAAGEYGDVNGRPHYHACVFGFDFEDKFYYKSSDAGFKLYASPVLDELWGMGNCDIGDVTFESAAYVARYTLSKRYGKDAADYYAARGVSPEDSWSSQGLAKDWISKFSSDVYPKDYFYVRGKRYRPPPYYDLYLAKNNPELLSSIKAHREASAKLNSSNINFDLRTHFEERTVHLSVTGEARTYSFPVRKVVSEIVHEASMVAGLVDNER